MFAFLTFSHDNRALRMNKGNAVIILMGWIVVLYMYNIVFGGWEGERMTGGFYGDALKTITSLSH